MPRLPDTLPARGRRRRTRVARPTPVRTRAAHLFSVENPFKGPLPRKLFFPVGRILDKVLGLDGIYDIYMRSAAGSRERPFSDNVLDAMDLTFVVAETDLARIPESGPVVVVANHCFGGVEGVLLASLLRMVRHDVRIMANYMLSRIPEMQDLFFFVDPFGGKDAPRANIRPMKQSIKWLRDGGIFGVFPSGEVAHFDPRRRAVMEGEWSSTIAGVIRRTEATVVPVFFDGSNTVLFHLLGLLHPRLRTARLPHELLNKKGRKIPAFVGRPVPYSRLEEIETDREMIDYLRMRTYNLRNRKPRHRPRVIRLPRRRPPVVLETPVADPVATAVLQAELERLPAEQLLLSNQGMEIWVAEASDIPAILREIGRLREEAFRAVGEGTGKAVDSDHYDTYYRHLFLWKRATGEVIAAYRLGATDDIVPTRGLRGLYTYSLFRYRRKMINRIWPALEMGRSFVRISYQKSYTPLLMLWKGIATYVALNPRYRYLFGPVSISDEYGSGSRDLLMAFLKMNNFQPELARLVKARTPVRQSFLRKLRGRRLRTIVDSMDDVESLIADVEINMKGMPILLRQYLKLGGKLLGFNIDPDFHFVLDGLILVDLVESDPRILGRYMGEDELKAYRALWHAKAGDSKRETGGAT
ncbi:MAG: lysophospholipid acyltransferase family protein [Lentisphaerae bacterium]|nr:lysophospholipid acyltransferase family protein [Lentisphaerota bacterium]